MNNIWVLGLLGIWMFGFGISHAQERGIGVTPGEILVPQDVDWPYSVPVTITNFSTTGEQFEVTGAFVTPGRFFLEAGASRRVLVTFEEPVSEAETQGMIKILSMQNEAEGLRTGIGAKIPFHIKGNSAKFFASAHAGGGSWPYIFGAGLLLGSVVLLWYIADTVRPWVWNSNKQ